MRDDALRPTDDARTTYDADATAVSRRGLDTRLTRTAAATAQRLRPAADDWSANEFGEIVFAAALVELKRTLLPDAYTELQGHYHTHREAFHAQLQPRAH